MKHLWTAMNVVGWGSQAYLAVRLFQEQRYFLGGCALMFSTTCALLAVLGWNEDRNEVR